VERARPPQYDLRRADFLSESGCVRSGCARPRGPPHGSSCRTLSRADGVS